MLTNLILEIVDHPDSVSIRPVYDGDQTVFLIRVAASDLVRVCGPGGRTAESLRIIVKASGIKAGCTYEIAIQQQAPFKPSLPSVANPYTH